MCTGAEVATQNGVHDIYMCTILLLRIWHLYFIGVWPSWNIYIYIYTYMYYIYIYIVHYSILFSSISMIWLQWRVKIRKQFTVFNGQVTLSFICLGRYSQLLYPKLHLLITALLGGIKFLHNVTKETCVQAWWRHQMETFSALLALCAGNSPITGEFPSQRPVTRGFNVFFDLRLNKESWDWWFETTSRLLWRHSNCIGPTWTYTWTHLSLITSAAD